MSRSRPEEEHTTTQNITNKLTWSTIKYSEVLEIARIIGYEITWGRKIRPDSESHDLLKRAVALF